MCACMTLNICNDDCGFSFATDSESTGMSVPVVVVTRPELAVNPYEGEYDFEQGL